MSDEIASRLSMRWRPSEQIEICGNCGAERWACGCGEGTLRDAVAVADLTGAAIEVDLGPPSKDSFDAKVSGVPGGERCKARSVDGWQCEIRINAAHPPGSWSHWSSGCGAFGAPDGATYV